MRHYMWLIILSLTLIGCPAPNPRYQGCELPEEDLSSNPHDNPENYGKSILIEEQ